MQWGQCTLQDLRCEEAPQSPQPVAADKPGEGRGSGAEGVVEPWGRHGGNCLGENTARDYPGQEIMRFAIWLVGLMCHLSALVRDTLQHRLHPKQGRGLFWFRCTARVEGVCGRRQGCPLRSSDPERFILCLNRNFSLLQKASSSSCHRLKSSARSASMTTENHSHTRCTTGGDGEV